MQDGGCGYPMDIGRAALLVKAYPSRFTPVSWGDFTEAVNHKNRKKETMPAMPKKAEKLEDGTYNFKIIKCETTKSEFGHQEEMTLEVLDEDLDEVGKQTRAWIGHKSYKTIINAIEAGVVSATYPDGLDESDGVEPESWDVKVPVYFKGIVIDGKIKKFKTLKRGA